MSQGLWDQAAEEFDDAPDHGLTDPSVRAAWRELLLEVLPAGPARVADLGCGTGTLARLLTDAGYRVDGLDFSPEMIRRAREKVPEAEFWIGDASTPPLEPGTYDVVLSRHVLWAMPDPTSAFHKWVELLKPRGVVVLIEGRWGSAGLTSAAARRIVLTSRAEATVRPMTEAIFWGKDIDDERYMITSLR
ncbi:class I SAM-dependent methyltransferase [Planctomonas sp. JC2975]|uniref:class I SAM-dependent methyltransferase n=1 Tax=Planctomonas sp. JC2975 TaxID=2729626 RepID=UPI001475449A|nr:class I SAM-dependent methyltransferase [Planctomonas sp. JC2975]NNC12369.1 class I SAM-dependent methyltransferase [Planctomonas sp. JC2975]